ncbi:MAG TPA: (5-formylfuran-3-yl)methyl phosphate synthase [Pirellulales bacterium]|nr:(5-formylfuran-3-yl)methyl phosphate synthase [Pirellulales bacterium]
MTRLLVSVRSLDEARLAAAAGVDLIDLKEPRRGPLGRVDLAVARQVANSLSPGIPLSMALGELAELTDGDEESVRHLPEEIQFAKIGLSRCADSPRWPDLWRQALGALPPSCSAVAVVYADWRTTAAPRPAAILAEAMRCGCRALLVDTFCKQAGDVFAHCSVQELTDIFARARGAGLFTVLAGSLRLEKLESVLALRPDYVAVRGAVCQGDREGGLCPSRLAEWVSRLASPVQA